MTPTESDKRLLQTVLTLTQNEQGRPPTLAEVTIALGYPSSSRGNIQRQLARLRPTFIEWEGGARSLRVTPSGQALLGATPVEGTHDLPLPDAILPLLASGITSLALDIANGKPLQAPHPQAWQRGLNMLATECFLRNVSPPMHTHEALTWCRRPLCDWPVTFRIPASLLKEAFLDEVDQPSALCREYALLKCDAEQEACQKIMVEVLSESRRHRRPDSYVKFRQFLIEHPVVTDDELIQLSFDSEIGTLGAYLPVLYERVPTLIAEQGKVQICRFCGWTLQRHQGHLRCGDDRCQTLTRDFMQHTLMERTEPPGRLQRVRRPIRRYVVVPGIYEVGSMQRLRSMGLKVDLWPGYDAYDLRITFPDQTIWAIDLKDWRYPHLLAAHLTPLDQGGSLRWDRAFYVVPDQRVQDHPGYLDILRNATVGQPFSIITIRELLDEAWQYKERLHA